MIYIWGIIEIIISYIETLLCFKFLEIVLKSKFRDNKTKIHLYFFFVVNSYNFFD